MSRALELLIASYVVARLASLNQRRTISDWPFSTVALVGMMGFICLMCWIAIALDTFFAYWKR